MKERLIEQLIEAKAYRAYCVQRYQDAFIFTGKWAAEIEACDAEINELEKQIEKLP